MLNNQLRVQSVASTLNIVFGQASFAAATQSGERESESRKG